MAAVPMGYAKLDYDRGDNEFTTIARLKPGVTLAQAQAEMEAIANRLAQEQLTEDAGTRTWLVSLGEFGREGLRIALLACW